MSTEYHRLKAPISSIRRETHGDTHTYITVFCNGAGTGTLCFRNDEAKAFLEMLHEENAFLTVYYAGKEGRKIAMPSDATRIEDLSPSLQLVSEYGELVTLADLIAHTQSNPASHA